MIDQAVTNSTCLIVLDRIGHLDLLRQVFTKLFAPPIVQTEVGIQLEWLAVSITYMVSHGRNQTARIFCTSNG